MTIFILGLVQLGLVIAYTDLRERVSRLER